ncbi:photosystem I chlorophyll a/b-binding protein 5, chloroplastic [Physcomitrium patens]|uniref:Chlorophyll a-b binding protein, chloroplastic n=2 Tax=Physcomitrium patens TaxID=3218 RepID=A0A2K1KN29_PHYPA|nr:photosystem I chlorophyll a/b-binding protein 5, chloroplastic-like [Physcomitrium patens]PNR55188.1 hypothetical protein PHYPA_006083 [Physcomitrium patens]|eukprot:XP_024372932.1 photosystem I chlorophyll a/b-binding protein 5, chloroplastic-like [Physcomitrella patens]
MALLYSVVASAATTLTAAASSIARPSSARRHGELRFCAPGAGRIVKVPAGKCSAVAQAGTAGESSATVGAERPLWLPGTTPPAHLDGTLAGDFGFDPLGLGQDPQDLRWYVQAELVHSRFAMAGVAGILFTDLLRASGRTDIPVWFEAGATKFDFADTTTLFVVQLILMGFVETKRWMDIVKPGSQAAEDSFFGFEAAFEGLETGYPGGPLFNPLGFANDPTKPQPLRWKEIKNGRLAMVAMVGFMVQAYVTKTGPIENLLTHLSDPVHNTIIQRIAN